MVVPIVHRGLSSSRCVAFVLAWAPPEPALLPVRVPEDEPVVLLRFIRGHQSADEDEAVWTRRFEVIGAPHQELRGQVDLARVHLVTTG
jgi:hypothetical protein